MLVLRQGAPLDRTKLAYTLWPDSEEARALFYLRRSLTNLRSVLGTEQWRIFANTPRSVSFDASGVRVDVTEFEAALRLGDMASLQAAVNIYRGPLCQDWYDEWIAADRARLELAYLAALNTLMEQASAQNDWAEAARYCRLMIAVDPLQESAYRALMQALANTGSHAAALLVYRDLRLRLHETINADPDAVTQALFETIRSQSRPSETASTGRASRQVASPSEASAANRGTALPIPLTRLIGREELIGETVSLINSARVITLVGPGGVGKTRLAGEIARDFAKLGCRVVYVDLVPISDPGYVAQTVATAAGFGANSIDQPIIRLAELLGAEPTILVLDNCEHLLSSCSKLVRGLAEANATLKILCTSRQSLRINGEAVLQVRPLLAPPAVSYINRRHVSKHDASDLLQYESVQLFLDRARQIQYDFRLTPETLHSIGQICRRLDGLPLAIELAASRCRALSICQIEARLSDRFELLTDGDRASHSRQRTLRAAIEWSYDMLEPEERTLLNRLSVFAGDWSLEAVETICASLDNAYGETTSPSGAQSGWYTCDLLVSLFDKCLVSRIEREGQNRYQLLESIKDFARSRLALSDEFAEIRNRHFDYYREVSRQMGRAANTADQKSALVTLDLEHDNIRCAIDYCLERGETPLAGLEICGSLAQYWRTRGLLREGYDRLSGMIAADRSGIPTKVRGNAYSSLGSFASLLGEFKMATNYYNHALEVYAATGDLAEKAMCLNNMGITARHCGDLTTARSMFEQSLAIKRAAGNQHSIASSLNNLGSLEYDLGNYLESRRLHYEALEIRRKLGDTKGMATALHNLGALELQALNTASARALLTESLKILTDNNDIHGTCGSIEAIGLLNSLENDYIAASVLWGFAERLRETIDSTLGSLEQARLAEAVRLARDKCDKLEFASAWETGRSISLEYGLHLALQGPEGR